MLGDPDRPRVSSRRSVRGFLRASAPRRCGAPRISRCFCGQLRRATCTSCSDQCSPHRAAAPGRPRRSRGRARPATGSLRLRGDSGAAAGVDDLVRGDAVDERKERPTLHQGTLLGSGAEDGQAHLLGDVVGGDERDRSTVSDLLPGSSARPAGGAPRAAVRWRPGRRSSRPSPARPERARPAGASARQARPAQEQRPDQETPSRRPARGRPRGPSPPRCRPPWPRTPAAPAAVEPVRQRRTRGVGGGRDLVDGHLQDLGDVLRRQVVERRHEHLPLARRQLGEPGEDGIVLRHGGEVQRAVGLRWVLRGGTPAARRTHRSPTARCTSPPCRSTMPSSPGSPSCRRASGRCLWRRSTTCRRRTSPRSCRCPSTRSRPPPDAARTALTSRLDGQPVQPAYEAMVADIWGWTSRPASRWSATASPDPAAAPEPAEPAEPTRRPTPHVPDELVTAAMTGDRDAVARLLRCSARWSRATAGASSGPSTGPTSPPTTSPRRCAWPSSVPCRTTVCRVGRSLRSSTASPRTRSSTRTVPCPWGRSDPVADVPDIVFVEAGPEQQAMRAALSEQLRDLLEELPEKQREILVLRIVVGLTRRRRPRRSSARHRGRSGWPSTARSRACARARPRASSATSHRRVRRASLGVPGTRPRSSCAVESDPPGTLG